MKIKSFVLLASMGLMFFLPEAIQATETTQQVKAQQATMTALEKQVTEIETQQVTIEEKLQTFILDKESIDKELAALLNEKETIEQEVEAEEARLRVVDTIQGYLVGVGTQGMEVISIKDKEEKIKELNEKVEALEINITEKMDELAAIEANRRKEITVKETITEKSEELSATLAKEAKALEELKAQQAAEEAQAKAAAEEAKKAAEKIEATGFVSPLTISLNVSSPFGYRADPTGYSGNGHDGMDFTGNYGDAILAARYGTVVEAGSHWSAGNYAIIKHDNGYYSYYMHMTDVFVSVGQTVATLEQIGTMGTTGNSTGVHLHFGIATGVWSGFVNPASFIM